METAHGVVVVVELADDEVEPAFGALPAAERAHAERLTAVRRREFVAGRTALHELVGDVAILPDDRGAPVVPGHVASVSHKGALAAALVVPAGDAWIGVDLERAEAPRGDIAKRILTPREQAALPDRGRAVTLRFAIKEAIYKAIDPTLRRYVGFTEVELDVGDGTCHVHAPFPLAIEAAWCEHAGHWIATARAVSRRT